MRVCSHRRQCNTEATHRRADVQARTVTDSQEKIRLISRSTVYSVSDIKLIRTDTTLDLSQKAEKVCLTTLQNQNTRRSQSQSAAPQSQGFYFSC